MPDWKADFAPRSREWTSASAEDGLVRHWSGAQRKTDSGGVLMRRMPATPRRKRIGLCVAAQARRRPFAGVTGCEVVSIRLFLDGVVRADFDPRRALGAADRAGGAFGRRRRRAAHLERR